MISSNNVHIVLSRFIIERPMNYQELQEAKQTFRLHALEKEYKPLFKAREDFVRRFSPSKISSMKIDDYVQGKQSKTSFCYILERTLRMLGNIGGQPSSKFGIWYYLKALDTSEGKVFQLQ